MSIDRTSELRNRLRTENLTGDQVNEIACHLSDFEYFQKAADRTFIMWPALAAFSGYNLSRMSVLSNTGRAAAGVGLVVGLTPIVLRSISTAKPVEEAK